MHLVKWKPKIGKLYSAQLTGIIITRLNRIGSSSSRTCFQRQYCRFIFSNCVVFRRFYPYNRVVNGDLGKLSNGTLERPMSSDSAARRYWIQAIPAVLIRQNFFSKNSLKSCRISVKHLLKYQLFNYVMETDEKLKNSCFQSFRCSLKSSLENFLRTSKETSKDLFKIQREKCRTFSVDSSRNDLTLSFQ